MRILIRTSQTAIWSRRLGRLGVALLVVSVLLHRFALISTVAFQFAVLFAALVSAVALLIFGIAIVRLWFSGDHGWRNAFWGAFWALTCLAPIIWYGQLAVRYPVANDVSTGARSFLPLMLEPDTVAMASARSLSRTDQLAAFPNALPRVYPIDPVELHALVTRLVSQKGWELRFDRAPSVYPGRVNARITDLLGWRDEVVFGFAATEGGTKVDMRSVSIGAFHDFGSNGRRIEAFLAELDAEVTAFMRDQPSGGVDDALDQVGAAAVETGES